MADKTRSEKSNSIADLCEQSGCNEKIAAIHKAQYVDRNWNPHPPQAFVKWWPRGKAIAEQKTDRAWRTIDEVRAYNCEAVREIWRTVSHVTND